MAGETTKSIYEFTVKVLIFIFLYILLSAILFLSFELDFIGKFDWFQGTI